MIEVFKNKYTRFNYMPPHSLYGDGNRVTGCGDHIRLSREAACESMVLLKNENHTLPLQQKRIALFGEGNLHMVIGGGGSGAVSVAYQKSVYDGLQEKHIVCDVVDADKAEDAVRQYDVALITITRYSAEETDRKAEKGDYYLSDEEEMLIRKVTDAFDTVILVLNIGAVIDCEYFAENPRVKAILCCWQPGLEGGAAVADILLGERTPSGKLVDTFAKSYEAYPSAADFLESDFYMNYTEDIYVGYRYFETIPGKSDLVRYPFGYGLSYTTFHISHVLCCEENGVIAMSATITNTGDYSGKEVLQIYYHAPQGLLGKPEKQLIAFHKTKLLKPGEHETIALSFAVRDMASFDDLGKIKKSAFVLEKGDYEFYLSTSVRDGWKLDYVYHLDSDVVTEQLSSQCRPAKLEKRMLSDGTYEALPMGEYAMEYETHEPMEGTAPEKLTTFDKVGTEISMENFLAQMTDDELIRLVNGTPGHGLVNTSCFGGFSRLGIPKVPTADGPAGLRILPQCEVYTTAWPVATALACTWNVNLVEQIGICGAKEVKENNFGIWLTPALNIHRNPLCGRNFEYFSEDPVISGKMAAAKVRGIQSQNIAASVKHFACNSKEMDRHHCDSRVSERALREIYLKGFEICIKESEPWTVMSSYNLLNGYHTSERFDLITTILRREWGYQGMVTSDWNCLGRHVCEIKAGNDMKMPFAPAQPLKDALQSGELMRADLEACAVRTLNMYLHLE